MHPFLWLLGYCAISVSESDAARLVNTAAACEIGYCAARERRDGRVAFLVSLRLSTRLLRACAEKGIDAREEERRGAPVLAARLCRRPGILLGALLWLALGTYLSGIVWRVDVVGNDKLCDDEVEGLLLECGMSVGSRTRELDVKKIANRALIKSDSISWMSINVTGTVAEVEIRETLPEPEPLPPAASNVIAAENGTVVGFEDVRGNLAVSIGDAVSKGDLLIGGVYGGEGEATRFVRAEGRVLATCERELEVEVPLKYQKKVYTGNKKVQKTLIFFKKEVNFFGKGRNSYASCDTINIEEYVSLFGLGELPIGIRTVTYLEYEYVEAQRSEAEARAEAKRVLWQRLERACGTGAELIRSELETELCDGVCRVRARIESVENIAREQEIEITLYD